MKYFAGCMKQLRCTITKTKTGLTIKVESLTMNELLINKAPDLVRSRELSDLIKPCVTYRPVRGHGVLLRSLGSSS